MEYNVENFIYNGFYIKPKEGKASYKARFKHWTSDPGIALCECSDGKNRLIPSCQLVGFLCEAHVKQEKTGVYFGAQSQS